MIEQTNINHPKDKATSKCLVSLLNFISNERDEQRLFSFYLSVRERSYKGSIHNYKKLIPVLSQKMGIHESTFRRLLAEGKRKGYFHPNKEEIRPVSHRKINAMFEKKYPNLIKKGKRTFFIKEGKYKDIILFIKSIVLFNNQQQQQFLEQKKTGKFKTKKSIPGACQKFVSISRERMKYLLGYKSKASSSYFMKKIKQKDYLLKDEARVCKIGSINKYDYLYNYSKDKRYYYKEGNLMKRLTNELLFSKTYYIFE